jgi:hypothetical protein
MDIGINMDKNTDKSTDNITISCKTYDIEQIQMIMRQTDYDEGKVIDKLTKFNGDSIKVIKDFMGIAEKKAPPIKSLNQEIYKQIRTKLDASIQKFNQEQDEKLAKEIESNNAILK